MIVEGFLPKPLKIIAESNQISIDGSWQSIRSLVAALQGKGLNEDDAKAVCQPLRELHLLRNPVKAHGDPEGRDKIASEARTTHGTLRAHYEYLMEKCDLSMQRISRALLLEPESTDGISSPQP